jgi:hypothetical protein
MSSYATFNGSLNGRGLLRPSALQIRIGIPLFFPSEDIRQLFFQLFSHHLCHTRAHEGRKGIFEGTAVFAAEKVSTGLKDAKT